MKLLATAIFTGMLAFGTAACAKEEPKKATPVAAAPAAAPAAATASDTGGPGKGEMKEVCNDKTDKAGKVINGKDGKPVQVCKKIKVRKKVEGTEVPDGKKK
jgi:hypothetical protein